jgi:DNA-binding LytR/AlgR family response regulator
MAHTLEIIIDAKEQATRVVIYAAQLDEEVQALADRLECTGGAERADGSEHTDKPEHTDGSEHTHKPNRVKRMLGYRDEEVILLDFDEIVCFFAQGQTVQARTRYGIVRIRHRLYELEKILEGSAFIRISNSEIVNFNHVRSFEFSLGGTLSLKTTDNERSYVSRRYTKDIKNYLGI